MRLQDVGSQGLFTHEDALVPSQFWEIKEINNI